MLRVKAERPAEIAALEQADALAVWSQSAVAGLENIRKQTDSQNIGALTPETAKKPALMVIGY
jgi:hypothetical protein